jgi:RNA polymerase sigma-70 factor (ECF subfamily)
MRAGWEALHASLKASVMTLKANQQMKEVGASHAVLARFDCPEAPVAYLTEKGGDLDEKDAIYATLVTAVQSAPSWADLAQALLWLGLWPGLDAVYRRRLRHFLENPEHLVGDVSSVFTTLIRRIDLGGVRRLAATLVRNVDRDVGEQLRRRWADDARHEPLVEDSEAFADPASAP